MESQLREKRSKTIQFITLGSLVAFCSTMTGCTTSPTAIAQRDKDKEKEKEENRATGGGHYYGGGSGGRVRMPMANSGTSRPSGTVSRGWFGGFHFSGG